MIVKAILRAMAPFMTRVGEESAIDGENFEAKQPATTVDGTDDASPIDSPTKEERF